MSKYLDLNGLSTLWGKIKAKFATKDELNSGLSSKQNALGINPNTGSANKFLNQQGQFATVETDLSAYAKKADIPTTLPASDVKAWAKAETKPAYTKSEVGLGNVDNTADSAKDVKHAKSADSVAWSGVTGKPTTLVGYGITDAFGDNKLLASWANPWEGYDHYEEVSKGYITGEKGGDIITPVIQDYVGQYTLSFACWGAHGNTRENVAHIKVTVYEYTVNPSLYGSSSNLSEFAISKGTVVKETTIGDLQAVDNIDGDLRYLLDLVESSGSVKAWRVRFSDTETIAIGKAMVEVGTGKHSLYPDGPENVMEAVRNIYPYLLVFKKVASLSSGEVLIPSGETLETVKLDLNNGQWKKSAEVINGHSIYCSDEGTYKLDSGISRCRITFSHLPNLRIMVRSNGESGFDYVEIGKMDKKASRGVNIQLSFETNKSESLYTEVSLKNDGGSHFVDIIYSKDSSQYRDEDRGFFYFPDSIEIPGTSSIEIVEAETAAKRAMKAASDANVALADMNRYMEVVKKPIVTTSDTSVAMDANKMYMITIGSGNTLSLTVNEAVDASITNEWDGAFDAGATAPSVTWPANVNWGSMDMSIAPNSHYEFNIRQCGDKYYGILYSWKIK